MCLECKEKVPGWYVLITKATVNPGHNELHVFCLTGGRSKVIKL